MAEWISVYDRLPDKTGCYLVVLHGIVSVCYFCKGSFQSDVITHWMPLPEPPKEENNE